MNTTPALLEALLFYKGEPQSLKQLATLLGISEVEASNALQTLKTQLENRGIRLVEEGNRFALATTPEAHALIEKIRKEELEGPLGKAALETLAIVVYNHPVSRAHIDYVRGVNSTTTLRTLTIRGLIEKVDNPSDKRSVLYQPTPELPATLGVTSLSELPEYDTIREQVSTALKEKETIEDKDHETTE